MQPGERQLHLGLDASRADDPAVMRGGRQMVQQGALADSRLAAEDQHPALARAYAGNESFQHAALRITVKQTRGGQAVVEHASAGLSRGSSVGQPWLGRSVELAIDKRTCFLQV